MSSADDVSRAVEKIKCNFSLERFAGEYAYCSIFVLSHGDSQDKICCAEFDHFFFKANVLDQINHQTCPHLKGRPLLGFVRACRGRNYNIDEPDGRDFHLAGPSFKTLLVESYVLYSTPEGFYDTSSKTTGSEFIKLLCEGIEAGRDVEKIAKNINKEEKLRLVNDSSQPRGEWRSVLMTEVCFGRLTKKFKFY